MPTPPTTPTPPVAAIGAAERRARASALFRRLPADVDAVVLFDEQFVQYLTAFVFAPTERPIAAIVTRDGARVLFVPRLEREHAAAVGDADEVVDYPEYPGEAHPIDLLIGWLRERGLARRRVGVDHDGYPPVMGYVPRPLSAHLDVVGVSAAVDAQMAIKSDAEVALIRESARWGAVAHRLLQDGTKVGLTEHEVVGAACAEATRQLREAMGPGYRQRNRWISGALAIYRGQIGPESAFPHALAADLRFAAGDTLVTGAGADVWGYLSELERTMFLGVPSAEQRRWFDHMLALQDLAFAAIRPGARAADVDAAHRAYVDRHGLWPHWRHHVGHGLGQRIHEAPFLDVGDPTVLEPGMVLSVEPGLYVPGLGGFRHSDTVLVTDDGLTFLTDYPRDLASLTLPV
jgi:Xaa-Pro dipeptidase